MSRKRLVLFVPLVVAALAAAGVAYAYRNTQAQAASATFSATTVTNAKLTTCAVNGGDTFATTLAEYTGTATSSDPRLDGSLHDPGREPRRHRHRARPRGRGLLDPGRERCRRARLAQRGGFRRRRQRLADRERPRPEWTDLRDAHHPFDPAARLRRLRRGLDRRRDGSRNRRRGLRALVPPVAQVPTALAARPHAPRQVVGRSAD